MLYVISGGCSFILFLLFDLNKLFWKRPLMNLFMPAGMALLIGSTAKLVWLASRAPGFAALTAAKGLYLAGAAAFFALLIHALFFALPFRDTYADTGMLKLVDRGVYALCRHPGVLWFSGLYLMLWLFCEDNRVFWAFAVFSLLDILYAYIQDRLIFPRIIAGYREYRGKAPFLIPTAASARRFLNLS